MAVKKNQNSNGGDYGPPPETLIDAVFIKGEKVIVKEMKYSEALAIKPNPGWRKEMHQKGYHAYKSTETKDQNQ